MATRPEKPSTRIKRPTATQDHNSDGELGSVLEQLKALRQDVRELRDEVRAMGQRRVPTRERPRRDPGDAVPPGVAVQEPAPLSTDERKARRNLERLSRD